MKKMLQFARYEYRMANRRWGVWVAYGLVGIFYLVSSISFPEDEMPTVTRELLWQTAGNTAFMLNIFLPVVAGILASDRMVRDRKLDVRELQESTTLSRWGYLLGKFGAITASVLTPVLLLEMLIAVLLAAAGMPITIIPLTLLAFLGINLPAYAFLTVFSLACPLIMPLRVYQVLYTGYWFWGNFLNPDVVPNLSRTLLTPSGKYVNAAFFGGQIGGASTPTTAILNLLVLAGCILAALVVTERYFAWKARRA